jgi:hypothetical protein
VHFLASELQMSTESKPLTPAWMIFILSGFAEPEIRPKDEKKAGRFPPGPVFRILSPYYCA